VMDSIERGVVERRPERGVEYRAFVDMSGGSRDDAVLAIAHRDPDDRAVLDVVMDQGQRPPFDPRQAVRRFSPLLRRYGVRKVTGDAYAGMTFKATFADFGVTYEVASQSASELYESLEPVLNGHRVVLLDVPKLEQQLLGLVWRGGKIDHQSSEHDDWANSVAGVIASVLEEEDTRPVLLWDELAPRGRPADVITDEEILQVLGRVYVGGHDEHPADAFLKGRMSRSEAEQRVRTYRKNCAEMRQRTIRGVFSF